MELMKFRICAALLTAMLWQTAIAAETSMQVSAVKDDLSLTDVRGTQVRFRDLVFPDKERARDWMERHLVHRDFSYEAQGQDRYGAAQALSPVEEAMLRDGAAMLYAQDTVPVSWYKAEQVARADKKGIWASKDFILTPENAAQHMQEFHAVEGKIVKVYVGKDATYINFGEDWKTDFSVMARGRERRAMAQILGQLAPGQIVQVRGMIFDENGPMIRLTRADQIAIIPGGKPAAPATAAISSDTTVIDVGFANDKPKTDTAPNAAPAPLLP